MSSVEMIFDKEGHLGKGVVAAGITGDGLQYETIESKEELSNGGFNLESRTQYSDGSCDVVLHLIEYAEDGEILKESLSTRRTNSTEVDTFFEDEGRYLKDGKYIHNRIIISKDDEGNFLEYYRKDQIDGQEGFTSHRIEYGDKGVRKTDIVVNNGLTTINYFDKDGNLVKREVKRIKGKEEITAVYDPNGKIVDHKIVFLEK